MTQPSQQFAVQLAAVAQDIEATLAELLSDDVRLGEVARPAHLMEAMCYAVLGGGKRLRPFLAVETARMLGGDVRGVLRAGAAIELVHCYSLVHDDLPAMDDDDLRRTSRRCTRPTTRRPRSWSATRCKRSPSRRWPIRRPIRARPCAPISSSALPARRA